MKKTNMIKYSSKESGWMIVSGKFKRYAGTLTDAEKMADMQFGVGNWKKESLSEALKRKAM